MNKETKSRGSAIAKLISVNCDSAVIEIKKQQYKAVFKDSKTRIRAYIDWFKRDKKPFNIIIYGARQGDIYKINGFVIATPTTVGINKKVKQKIAKEAILKGSKYPSLMIGRRWINLKTKK